MPDRDHTRDLERELRDLGSRVEYPPTPDLAGTARRRIESEDETSSARRWTSWLPNLSPQWAAAAMLLLVLAAPLLSPTARDGISNLLISGGGAGGSGAQSEAGGSAADEGVSSDSAQSGRDLPSSAAHGATETTASQAGNPGSAGQSEVPGKDLGFGERITLREARAASEAPILLPRRAEIGRPDAVYAKEPPNEGGVALVYTERPDLPPIGGTGVALILTELPESLQSAYLENSTSLKDLETVGVSGERGYWGTSGSDALTYPGRTEILGANALIWERGGRALRLETNLPKREALRIASSVR